MSSSRSIAARSAPGGDHDRLAQRLAHAELRLPAGGQPEPHGLAHDGHRRLELDVARADLREVAQVDARLGAVEVVVDLVGDERAERRQQVRDPDQAAVQRPERRRVAVPEARPRAAHVPVRQLVDERRDRVAGARGVVGVEPLAHDLGRRVQARDRPAVELGLRLAQLLHVVDVRVQDVEAVRVPELQQELAQGLADRLGRELVAVPRQLGGEVVPAERVRPVAVDDLPRHDDVAERLRHLLALGVGDVAEDTGTCGTATGRTAASRSPAASRTSRASGRSPRRCSRPGSAPRSAPGSRAARGTARTASSRSRTRRRSPRARAAAARRRSERGSRPRPRTGGAGPRSGRR